jgi:protocatechuate 3,4-dioxygenase alpha subunit
VKRLVPSAEMTIGPFFPPEFAHGANELFSGKDSIQITGRVTELDGKPLDNVVIEIWQADAQGRYDNPQFFGWGRAATDANGVYVFRTLKPGSVEGRLAHINFLILYSGLMRQLQTTMFFELAADPVLNVVKTKERLIARREGTVYRFDLRLRGEGETPFFDD